MLRSYRRWTWWRWTWNALFASILCLLWSSQQKILKVCFDPSRPVTVHSLITFWLCAENTCRSHRTLFLPRSTQPKSKFLYQKSLCWCNIHIWSHKVLWINPTQPGPSPVSLPFSFTKDAISTTLHKVFTHREGSNTCITMLFADSRSANWMHCMVGQGQNTASVCAHGSQDDLLSM